MKTLASILVFLVLLTAVISARSVLLGDGITFYISYSSSNGFAGTSEITEIKEDGGVHIKKYDASILESQTDGTLTEDEVRDFRNIAKDLVEVEKVYDCRSYDPDGHGCITDASGYTINVLYANKTKELSWYAFITKNEPAVDTFFTKLNEMKYRILKENGGNQEKKKEVEADVPLKILVFLIFISVFLFLQKYEIKLIKKGGKGE